MTKNRREGDTDEYAPVQAPGVPGGYMDHNTIADIKAAVIGARPPFYINYDSAGKFRDKITTAGGKPNQQEENNAGSI